MNTRFGITAGLALVIFIGVFTAMLALGVISPLGVQGADHPIAGEGKGESFQQGGMVTNVTVTNTPKEPGLTAQYTVTFITGEVLQADMDTIVFDIDSSVGAPVSIPADAIRISASAVTGGGQANQSVALSLDPAHRAGSEGRDIYTITVPDMDASESSGIESIDAGAIVTVTFLFSAGLINPTESGSYDFTVSTSRETSGVKAAFTTPLRLMIDDESDHRDKFITLIGWGFKNGAAATVYLDRSRDADGTIVNVPDGMYDPGIDADLASATVESGHTFAAIFNVTVPPFAPVVANRINVIDNVIDDEDPPNHYNGMGDQTPVTFTVEPLLITSSSPVSIGGEIEISLVDWPAADQVLDHVTPDAQGVDRVKQSAVTVFGIPQEITSGEGPVGPGHEHTFLVRVGAEVPVGIHELRVKTYTADQVMSNVPGGASDTKKITVTAPRSVEKDRAALAALYNAADGANWTDNTNWLTNAPLDQWYGVEVDANGRVTLLSLDSNQLTGQMPLELGDLTNLWHLNLSNNRLTGEIPAELGSLSNLQALEISFNQLSGEIPTQLGRLTKLIGLFLNHNLLSGEIPAELGSLPNLHTLELNDNQLSGEIPAELGDLTNLWHLDLSENQLTGEIPADLGGLSNLWHLDLSFNPLSGEIPAELGSLTNLTRLYLLYNQLSGEIPAELGGLSNLQVLYLNNNRLRGEIPAEFGRLASLTYVTLSANRLSGRIPGELGGLFNLTFLDLRSNQLRGEIPAGLSLLSNLQWLSLSYNRLSGEIPSSLGSLSRLERLHLRDNRLSGEIPAELGNLSNLQSLWLEGNQLSGEIPTELSLLSNLQWLGLSYNRLSGEIPSSLGSLSRLEGLHLRDNRLSGEIPAELGNLSNLQSLWLEGNRLSGQIPTGLGDLMSLKSLDLAGNRLTGCVPASLRGVASHDLARLGLPFCDMLGGSPVVVIRFVSGAGAPVRLGSPVSLEAAFSEPVSGFALEDVRVANGAASNFAGSGAVYTLDVTPNAIGEAAVDIAAGVAEDADGNGNIAARLSFGIPYDDNSDGAISKNEVIAAINGYLFGDGSLAKSHLIDLINLYLFGGTP